MSNDVAGYRDVSVQDVSLPGDNIRPQIDEPLVLHPPGAPARHAIGAPNGAVPVRNRMGGIGDVAVKFGGGVVLGRFKGELTRAAEIELPVRDAATWRPLVVPSPLVGAGLKGLGF